MTNFNFLNYCSSLFGSWNKDLTYDCRFTVGSPSGRYCSSLLKLITVLVLVLTLGVGNVWGTEYFSDDLEVAGSSQVTARDNWSSPTLVYAHYGSAIRLGSSNNVGHITKTAMTGIGASPTTIVLRFAAKSYGTDKSDFTIIVNNAGTANTTNFILRQESSTSRAFSFAEEDYYEVIITGATSSTTITFSTTAAKKRVFLGDVSIYSYESAGKYVLIEDSKDIAEGDYLIVYDNKNALNTKFSSSSWNSNTYGTYTSISSYYSSKTKSIAANATTDGLAYHIKPTTNGYYIRKKSSGGFLGRTSSHTGNYLRWDSACAVNYNEWTLGVNSIVSVQNSSYAIRYNSGFKIYGPSEQSAVQLFKKTAPSCANKVTLATGSPTNGTISFSPVGPVETCNGSVDVTMTITPDAGYYLSAYSSSGASTSNSPSISTSGASASAEQTPTLTFAQGTNGTYTASATFTAFVDHFIDNIQSTTGFTGEGKSKSGDYSGTLAELSLDDGDKTSGSSCRKEHYHFVGWVTAATRTSKNGGPYLPTDLVTITGTATGTTYYAVWAMEDDE